MADRESDIYRKQQDADYLSDFDREVKCLQLPIIFYTRTFDYITHMKNDPDLSKIVDFLNQEERKSTWLRNELKAGADASKSEFIAISAGSLIAEAKARRKADGG